MKWEPIALVRVAAGRVENLTTYRTRLRYETLVIALGPKRQLKCGCTRTRTLLPEELDLPEDADTCIHIKLLYGNGIVRNSMREFLRDVPDTRGTVYLTERGKELFSWRYSAQALK